MNVRPFSCASFFLAFNFPDSVFSINTITIVPYTYISDLRTDEKTNCTKKIVTGLVSAFFFDDTGNYSHHTRWHLGELFDDRIPIFRYIQPVDLSWSIQFCDSWHPARDEKVYADMRSHICIGCCRYNGSLADVTHAGRVWISIKSREFPRKIVSRHDSASGKDSLTRFSSASYFFFIYSCRRSHRRMKSIHFTDDRLLVSLTM